MKVGVLWSWSLLSLIISILSHFMHITIGRTNALELPDMNGGNFLLGLGVQKGGTTCLYQMIKNLPWISKPFRKELRFWVNGTLDLFLNNYLSAFRNYDTNGLQNGTFFLEFTPLYIFDPLSPILLRKFMPKYEKLRFIVILREPIARAISGFGQEHSNPPLDVLNSSLIFSQSAMREVSETESCLLDESIAAPRQTHFHQLLISNSSRYCSYGRSLTSPNKYKKLISSCIDRVVFKDRGGQEKVSNAIRRGLYFEQLTHWLCMGFHPSQFFILSSRDLHDHYVQVVQEIAKFMGVNWTMLKNQLVEMRQVAYSAPGHRSFNETLPIATHQALLSFFNSSSRNLQVILNAFPFHIYNKTSLREELTSGYSSPLYRHG